jgi:BirA family transcriptional regulator, biotin operon repressor / biotin---[acetyl-CoA-carboxylase] ligase
LSKIKQSSVTLLPKKSDTLWIELDTVESTNNYAMALVHEGVAQHGMVIYAHHQSKGKGQRGKQWETIPGANLSFSILLQPHFLLPSQSFQLLAVTALAIRNQLEKSIGEETKIKWPNDLYWRDRKTGGILIENVFRGTQWQWAIIGIGVNVNQTAFSNLNNAVSMKQITGKNFDIPELARDIYKELIQAVDLLNKNGFTDFFKQYNQFLYGLNKTVRLKKAVRSFETIIKGVNEQGQLVTKVDLEECFDFGEVDWIIA